MNNFSKEGDIKKSQLSECIRKSLEYMNKLLTSNHFVSFSLAERKAILHKLDVTKDLMSLSNNTIVWMNGLIFTELSNNQETA